MSYCSQIWFYSCKTWRLPFGVENKNWDKIIKNYQVMILVLFKHAYMPSHFVSYSAWNIVYNRAPSAMSSWHMSLWCPFLMISLAILPLKYIHIIKEYDCIRPIFLRNLGVVSLLSNYVFICEFNFTYKWHFLPVIHMVRWIDKQEEIICFFASIALIYKVRILHQGPLMTTNCALSILFSSNIKC